jgi:hypothetical protein
VNFMNDLIFVAATLAFFAATALFVVVLAKI